MDLNNWYLDFGWVKLRLLGGLGLWGFGCSYWFGLFLLLGGHAEGYDATQRDRDGTGSDTLWVQDSMLRDDSLSSDQQVSPAPFCPKKVPDTKRKAVKGRALRLLFETHCSLTIDSLVHLYRAIETPGLLIYREMMDICSSSHFKTKRSPS